MDEAPPSWWGRVAAVWGVLGVLLILGQALGRLGPLALEAMCGELSSAQWAVLIGWVVAMAYGEGYRGFHRRFSPRVVARAAHLARHPTLVRGLFAPFFCTSLFGASRRGVIVARVLVVSITAIVVMVKQLPQPWRGIIDAGVVVGLGLGSLSVVYFAVRALFGFASPVPPDLPETEQSAARSA